MVLGLTRQDLQEELQSLNDSVLQVEFLKLNKRLESLERIFAINRTSSQSLLPPTNLRTVSSHPSIQEHPGEASPRPSPRASQISVVGSVRGSLRANAALKKYDTQEDWTDHYFRTYATGAEAKQWAEEEVEVEIAASPDAVKPMRSSKRFVVTNSRLKTGPIIEEDSQTAKIFTERYHTKSDKSRLKSTFRGRAMDLVSNPVFNGAIAACIFLNAVTLGVQTDHMVTQKLKKVPIIFKVIEWTFGVIFTLEIILKLVAYRFTYFTSDGWKWNVFDFFLVAMTILEEFLDQVVKFSFSNFSAIRVLRALRVVRILRVIRVLRMIGELRAIVASVLGSLRSLCWTVLLLFSIIYIIGIYFTQLLIEERISADKDFPDYAHFYGSISRSILTLYEAISGGVDWGDAAAPLINDMSPFYGVVFALYIAFTVLAILNVVTGVFVENALQSAQEDKEVYIVNHVRELIEQMLEDGDEVIIWERFEEKLGTQAMREIFEHIDVDVKEAAGLFRLLDLNDNGQVEPEEFLDGILKFGGHAKALDLALMMREIRKLNLKVQQIAGLWTDSTLQPEESDTLGTLRQAARDPLPVDNIHLEDANK